MAVDVEVEETIGRPLEAVASFAADPDNVPTWYQNIKSVEWKTERPLRVGSQIAFVAQFLGRRLAYTYEVVAYEPKRRLVMRTRQGPFPMETSYHWEAIGDEQTRMRLRNLGEPTGFSRLVAPFMASAMRRATRQDLARLKHHLESAGG